MRILCLTTNTKVPLSHDDLGNSHLGELSSTLAFEEVLDSNEPTQVSGTGTEQNVLRYL